MHHRRRWIFGAVLAAALTLAGTVTPTGVAATGALVSASSGRCLDVPNGTTTNGTPPIIWDCTAATNQVGTCR